jgi:putative ATP-dependent endonuclease of OLD family
VSIINIGSTAFTHYLNIFERVDGQSLGINVAMITDLDAKPFETPESKSGKEPEPITPRDEGTIQSEKKAKSEKIAEITKGDVKGFVSPNWTLEYEIALSKYRDDFYYSILWAEKIENSKKGEPREGKKEEVKEKVKRDIENWAEKYNEDPQKNEKIAFEIYKNTMLDKKISKAITAQVFAQKLEKKFNIESDKEKLKEEILSEPNLKYITDAIFHVTERELPEQEETVHEN